MRGQSDQDLDATADLFGRLATADPTDSAAWYNRGLCLAWMGKNLEAIGCLDRVVSLEAERAFDLAVDAWTLAEILRQGGGAETLADDLRFACTMAWKPGDTPWLLEEFPEIQRVPTPRAPGATTDELPRSKCSSGSIGRLQTSLSPPMPPSCHERFWRAFISAAERSGSRARGPRTSNGSRRPSSRGSRTAPARSGVKRRRCPCRFSTPMSGFFGSHRGSIPIGRTSSAARRSSSILKTSGSIARAMGWTADRRWPPGSRRVAVMRLLAPN